MKRKKESSAGKQKERRVEEKVKSSSFLQILSFATVGLGSQKHRSGRGRVSGYISSVVKCSRMGRRYS
jgi:hypothetical protein